MKILAIESSCDETAAAVVANGTEIIAGSVASSAAMHEKYGGIVPEVAAREQLRCIIPVITETLEKAHMMLGDIDALAVTVGPGLIGSLLVGVETAKTIAYKTGKPLIPVNHVLAHMYANFVNEQQINENNKVTMKTSLTKPVIFPAISLVVSGGHTELFLMTSMKDLQWLGGTLDDAAGEAFDKTARLLGFGSRGGLAIQEAAAKRHPGSMTGITTGGIKLPRPMLDDRNLYNFSFSGLKTAILREVNKLKENGQFNEETIRLFAHEVQESITDVLVKKTLRAADAHQAQSILLSGGVAANLRLREKMQTAIDNQQISVNFRVPPVSLCTDNAVYIAGYAFFRGTPVPWRDITAVPDLSVENV